MIRLEEYVLTTVAIAMGWGLVAMITGSYLHGTVGSLIALVWLWVGIIWGYGEAVLN